MNVKICDESQAFEALRNGKTREALDLWKEGQEISGACNLGYCDNTSYEWFCCAYHLQGRLLMIALKEPGKDHYALALKLGKWIKEQEIKATKDAPVPPSQAKTLTIPDSLTIGHPIIDYDHRRLLTLLNEIGEMLEEGNYKACRTLIETFAEYAETHFKKEDFILKDSDFEYLPEHNAIHEALREKLIKFIEIGKSLDNSGIARKRLFPEMASFLLEDAIKSDLEFKTFLVVRGMSGIGN